MWGLVWLIVVSGVLDRLVLLICGCLVSVWGWSLWLISGFVLRADGLLVSYLLV